MIWPFHHKALANYWLKAFALYALVEACIQLLFCYILNNFGNRQISNLEFHAIMWVFQCILIWPIWWVAWSVRKKAITVQVVVNIIFYFLYSYCWFGPVQQMIEYFHQHLQGVTRSPGNRIPSVVDSADNFAYLNYQLLKHGFRLSWFFLANYFYQYRLEEKKRMELAVANKELQLKLLKWHLNPGFYFKTIDHLRQVAAERPLNCTGAILQLAKVMEYVIYEVKEKLIDVKKEINFLSNYIQLVNQQPGNTAGFSLTTTGEYDQLRIAPLLLAGFIDKIAAADDGNVQRSYNMQLRFSGNEMLFQVEGDLDKRPNDLVVATDPLYIRLQELYPRKFIYEHSVGDRQLKLSLKLDEEK
jgi:Histidine kinase